MCVNVFPYLQEGAPVFELLLVQQVVWSDVTKTGSLHPEHNDNDRGATKS